MMRQRVIIVCGRIRMSLFCVTFCTHFSLYVVQTKHVLTGSDANDKDKISYCGKVVEVQWYK